MEIKKLFLKYFGGLIKTIMYKLIGKRLDGRYEFLERIGVGGMADVYRAYDNVKRCDVAVKVLKEEFSKNKEFVRRFQNESKANASLLHPNIVRIFDVDFGDKIQYIVMEYIDGVTLKEFIEKAKVLDWKDVVHFTFQILRALQHAHDKGIVHRDMKPQNIMLLEDGTIKIMDFGIARFARDEKVSYGKAIGSVHYMSPEQASGGVTDAKSDLYSVGIIMYEMLTGKLPFEGKTPEVVAVKQIQSYAKSPTLINPAIPQGLVDIVVRAMQKMPDKRYQSATEMLHDIDEFKKNPDILFEYKYLNDESNTKYFSLAEKEDMKHFSQNFGGNNYDFNRRGVNKSEKKEKLIPILLVVAAGFFLVALIIIGVLILGRGKDPRLGEIELPNFVGMSYDEVKDLDKSKYGDLRFVVDYEDNANYDEGVVCSQTPSPGIHVKRDSKVQISLSNGKKKKNVPDVVGLNYKSAQVKLNREGFKNLKLIKKSSDSVMEDDIIATDPEGGVQVSVDREIKIYYSSGVDGEKLEVPNVVGKNLDEAKLELKKAGFDVDVFEKYDSSLQENVVVSQSKTGKLNLGSKVKIVVNTKKADKKESANRNEEKQISYSLPLSSDKAISDTFNVVVTNTVNGQVVSEGKYSVDGNMNLVFKGSKNSGPLRFDVRIKNNSTGKVAKYGVIIVDFSAESSNSIVNAKLDHKAFSRTLMKVDGDGV